MQLTAADFIDCQLCQCLDCGSASPKPG